MNTPERIVQMALLALTEADFIGVVEQFNEQFTFIDHAIELDFKDKRRLTDFLALNRELFPDSKRADNIICSSGNKVVSEWVRSFAKANFQAAKTPECPTVCGVRNTAGVFAVAAVT
jgi:hypothetical protein